MSQTKKHKHFDIPLKVNGSTRFIKGVTKHTTCSDVIKMVLKKSTSLGQENNPLDSYAIFESSRGIERILPGKNRLVKVMRSWGTDSNFEFVFRKVNPIVSVPKISEAKRRRLTQRLRTLTESENNTSNTQTSKYKEVATLAGLVQSQKTKLNRYESLKNSGEFVKELYFKDSDDSMDEFISCVDKEHMEGILDFCGAVTSGQINKLSASASDSLNANIREPADSSLIDSSHVSMTKVNNVKYAVRKTLKSKTLSTSNVLSVSSDENNINCRPLKHKFVDSTPHRNPCHSTPSNKVPRLEPKPARRHEQLASAIVTEVSRMDQKDGKDALLQKYFAEYIAYNSPGPRTRTCFRTRGDGAEDGYQSPLCRRGDGAEDGNLAQRQSTSRVVRDSHDDDVDSGQEEESEASCDFDTAFIDENANISTTKCVGKLVDYSLSEDDNSFDDPSIIEKVSEGSDVSDACDVSSVSDLVKNAFSDSNCEDEDDLMASFMKTKHAEDFLSDEGLSSMASDDEKEILV